MNTIRNFLLGAAITLMGITACNYTVGECWPVGQGGGSGSEGVTAGGGVIIPTGPAGGGGYGDEPPKQPQDSSNPDPKLKCNSDEDSNTESPAETPKESPAENKCNAGEAGSLSVCRDGCSGPCGVAGGPFAPDIFKFVTIIPDDGTDEAGGWQVASAKLRIVRYYPLIVEFWYCPVQIGMPLRTVVNGKISPEYAAILSTQIANQAAKKVREEDKVQDYPQGIFCARIKAEMISIIKSPLSPYKSFGISVQQ